MTYRPRESVYAVPWLERIPSFVYLAAALVTIVLVVIGEHSAPGSWLYEYIVVQDRGRLMGSRTFATVLSIGAVSSVLRAGMRGVRIFGDGVEAREVSQLFVPRIRRYRWPQMALIVLDQPHVAVELWDGQRAVLPAVSDREGLVAALERVAAARDIPVQGGAWPGRDPGAGLRRGGERMNRPVRPSQRAALGTALVLVLAAPLALARSSWWQEATIRVVVHEHVFNRATANALGCRVRVRLHFEAPPSAYAEPAPERNHYRFAAKLSFSDNLSFVSEPVANTESGARVIAFTQDTSDEGCWAEREHALRKVDVHACRGPACVPEPFE